jgi:hypothetical protein
MFEDDTGSCPMERFLDELSEDKFAALDAALNQVLAKDGLNLASTKWLLPLGGGLFEFRVRHSEAEIVRLYRSAGHAAPEGAAVTPVLLRVFVHFYGSRICLLLGGYDKGRDVSKKRQQREIATARRLLAQWRQQR